MGFSFRDLFFPFFFKEDIPAEIKWIKLKQFLEEEKINYWEFEDKSKIRNLNLSNKSCLVKLKDGILVAKNCEYFIGNKDFFEKIIVFSSENYHIIKCKANFLTFKDLIVFFTEILWIIFIFVGFYLIFYSFIFLEFKVQIDFLFKSLLIFLALLMVLTIPIFSLLLVFAISYLLFKIHVPKIEFLISVSVHAIMIIFLIYYLNRKFFDIKVDFTSKICRNLEFFIFIFLLLSIFMPYLFNKTPTTSTIEKIYLIFSIILVIFLAIIILYHKFNHKFKNKIKKIKKLILSIFVFLLVILLLIFPFISISFMLYAIISPNYILSLIYPYYTLLSENHILFYSNPNKKEAYFLICYSRENKFSECYKLEASKLCKAYQEALGNSEDKKNKRENEKLIKISKNNNVFYLLIGFLYENGKWHKIKTKVLINLEDLTKPNTGYKIQDYVNYEFIRKICKENEGIELPTLKDSNKK